jgi:hypothetical protein
MFDEKINIRKHLTLLFSLMYICRNKTHLQMKPSDFSGVLPMGSVTQKAEAEQIAINIMRILKRTGDEWRELTWDEYAEIRKADEAKSLAENPKYRYNFSEWAEKIYFYQVCRFCRSEESARSFSPLWSKVGS